MVYVHKLADDMRFYVGRGMRLTDFASAKRDHFARVEADVLPFYKSLVLDFAVAAEQNYRPVLRVSAAVLARK